MWSEGNPGTGPKPKPNPSPNPNPKWTEKTNPNVGFKENLLKNVHLLDFSVILFLLDVGVFFPFLGMALHKKWIKNALKFERLKSVIQLYASNYTLLAEYFIF